MSDNIIPTMAFIVEPPTILEELKTLRARVAAQRNEIARLHAERDLLWEPQTVKVQTWRGWGGSGVVGRSEQFVLKGRRCIGVIRWYGHSTGKVEWLGSFGAGVALNWCAAIAALGAHDTLAGAVKAGEK